MPSAWLLTQMRPWLSPTTVLLSLALAYALHLILYRFKFDPLRSVPGPEIARWTDLHVRLLLFRGGRSPYVHSLHQKYGPVVRVGPKEVDISDYKEVKKIHRHNSGFTKSSFYDVGKAPQSLFTARDVGFHTQRRRLLGPSFNAGALATREQVIRGHVKGAVDGIGDESKKNGQVDILKWWTLMAMDVIGEVSFGDSFGMVERGHKTQFAEDVAKAGSILPLRSAFPFVIAMGAFLSVPMFNDIARSRQRIISHQMARVDRFMKLVREEPDSEKARKTLFASLMQDKNNELGKVELTIEGLSYITAGTDTTAITMSYLVWAVCRDDMVRARLTKELEKLPAELEYNDVKNLTYLNCVVEEALRRYGAAPGALPRDTPPEGATLGGMYFPPGVVISTQGYSLHRDASVFSEPERFHPERWENASKEMRDAFVAFGTGPRACIGIHLARMELRLATASFFRAYPGAQISTKDGMSDEDMEETVSFLLMPKGHRCLVEV
ncbi:cytochrome P450 [Diaporthe sp. PMI_573]|nr:cytochrome P450 [Diaporthaceae sp. PMI_573]